jgi:RND superfamily putative drug exporter
MTAVRDERTGTPDGVGPPAPRRSRWLPPALAIVAFLAVGGALGGLGGQLSQVEKNDSATYLPKGAEAARVLADSKRFTGLESTAAIVVLVEPHTIGRNDEIQLVLFNQLIVGQLSGYLAAPPAGPTMSPDGRAAQTVFLFRGSDPTEIRSDVETIRRIAAGNGLDVHITGPAAARADLTDVFSKIDVVMVLITAAVIAVILLLVYRSPILPVLVLGTAGIALGIANGLVYLLARHNLVIVSGDAQGILDVLVLGAGTDYALLLIARFREELRRDSDRYAAMRVAWRATAPSIVASGATVILGMLCLLLSDLTSTHGLGPVAGVGILSALVCMLALLPAFLVLVGRAAFWPLRPRYDAAPARQRGVWPWIAGGVGRRPRLIWVLTVLVLAGLSTGLVRLQAHGVPRTQSFLAPVDSTTGENLLSAHFPDASATPAVIIARAEHIDAVLAAVTGTPGITKATAYIDPAVEYAPRLPGTPAPGPMQVNGMEMIQANLAAAPDSAQAEAVIRQLRRTVHAVPGAQVEVGGYTAANLDVQDTASRDRVVIIPAVLVLVFLVLCVLLRSAVAPLLLIGTVILSFLAALGVSGVVFRDVFHFAGADASFPLYVFVFLVALGVDYNVFLMTRVREEIVHNGHRGGTLKALAVTGGVISSAGLVLAATFAALAVLPLVVLVELAFAVSFGVLLDTVVVRTLLVPSLLLDLGPVTWWPGRRGLTVR